jgi:selenocysteine lyase/cysteine desulfurase
MGPLGTGLLAIQKGLEKDLFSLRQGGTGTTSESEHQPLSLPEKYEAGNHNAPGLAGLGAALAWHEEHLRSAPSGRPEAATAEQSLIRQFTEELAGLAGIQVHYARSKHARVGVVSISFDRMTPQVAAALLDEHFGIETRAGFHCAPRAHATMQTLEQGGTVRFSFGAFTSEAELAVALEAIVQISAAL